VGQFSLVSKGVIPKARAFTISINNLRRKRFLGSARPHKLLKWKNARFVSGHRFSDAVTASKSDAPSGAAEKLGAPLILGGAALPHCMKGSRLDSRAAWARHHTSDVDPAPAFS